MKDIKLRANIQEPPLGALIVAEILNSTNNGNITVELVKEWNLPTNIELLSENSVCTDWDTSVSRILVQQLNPELSGGDDIVEKTQVDTWINFSRGPLMQKKAEAQNLDHLNTVLATKTFLVSKKLTLADIYIFCSIFLNSTDRKIIENYCHLNRWYKQMSSLPAVQKYSNLLSSSVKKQVKKNEDKSKKPSGNNVSKEQGKFIELPGAEMGKVVVRFPPEASGFLHIGHAKAALLNQHYANAFKGQLIMRFDDTNPAKENVVFEQAILEDLKSLEVKPDRFTHSSDYFDMMLNYCEKMLKEGKAFADDTPADIMKEQREKLEPSGNRDNTPEKNLKMWEEMKLGTEKGQQYCIRAKMFYDSPNGCMRDPTIYRCKPEPHPRTGTKYNVYPTYDFACPIVDAVEGVTHTLRTTEYLDRDSQFNWFIDALELRRPYIWAYSRLNMTNTVLSKRKLTWFVDEGLVDGWDDPRFPTVRGILRRGMTVEGLKQFIIAQGSSGRVVFMEWDKIWSFNKKVIDPIAIRYTALNEDELIPVNISGATETTLTVQNHPKDSSIGTKKVQVGSRILIERTDAETLIEGQHATFINWGNVHIQKIKKENGVIIEIEGKLNLDNKDFKNTVKLTWLVAKKAKTKQEFLENLIPCYAVYFDHIISKPVLGKDDDFKDFVAKDTRKEVKLVGESELKRVKKGEIIQLQRKGFFRCDVPYAPICGFSSRETPLILFHIPDGHTNNMTSSGASGVKETTIKTTTEKKKESSPSGLSGEDISSKIAAQGDKVRDLKASKAEKSVIAEAVKLLLQLKADYKEKTGQDWKPGVVVPTSSNSGDDISAKITAQGDKVRQLKSDKAGKGPIDEAVKKLLALKTEFKQITGQDWKPSAAPAAVKPSGDDISAKITAQGDKVRQLKSDKAGKGPIDEAVKQLLALKAEFKQITGEDWKPSAAPVAVKPSGDDISAKITAQGDKVRQLKSDKAGKGPIDEAVKQLLALKAEFKQITGEDWKPSAAPVAVKPSGDNISAKITAQGDKVRQLKSDKAGKGPIDEAVKQLLALKAEFKQITGEDWKPTTAPVATKTSGNDISDKITTQGDKVRQLKSDKAGTSPVDEAVKQLMSLKAEFKQITGQDWKPIAAPVAVKSTGDDISAKITAQGDKVRTLKGDKAEKFVVDDAVKLLLQLKAEFKEATGQDWKPPVAADKKSKAPVNAPEKAPRKDNKVQQNSEPKMTTEKSSINTDDEISAKITAQGEKVRQLKVDKAENNIITAEVSILLKLKNEFKEKTGQEWKPAGGTERKSKDKSKAPEKAPRKDKVAKVVEKKDEGNKTGTRLGLEAKKLENLSDWYSQVITKGEMIEYYDVSGCYILRPWSYSIWESIKDFFDVEIKKLGVKNCSFPMFVSKSALEREKDHIADFAPEVAWVTKSGDSDLAEPIAIRPTSETVMYPSYAKWLKSHRDLPLKLNQWNSVVRWEFKHPQPFLRTREFLWQEGHTAFLTKPEADEEVLNILELYARIYEEYLAIPVIRGRKSEKEKFAGGDYTTTVEAFVSASGRAIQGATSHHLGQNFSKMFDIQVADGEGGDKSYVYQNSWGITTRTIGVMVMVHGDDKGLVLPPMVASIQAVIVPCGITATTTVEQRKKLMSECLKLEDELKKENRIRVEGDYRDNCSPGWKFNHWELKGVPIRIELGFKDLEKNQVTLVRRDNAAKLSANRNGILDTVCTLLKTIQTDMFEKASHELKTHKIETNEWSVFCKELDNKNLLLSPFCGEISCEDNIKADSTRKECDEPGAPSMGAKTLCIPFNQPKEKVDIEKLKCVHPDCKNKAKFYTLFGRSY